jgi:hypothetical protein
MELQGPLGEQAADEPGVLRDQLLRLAVDYGRSSVPPLGMAELLELRLAGIAWAMATAICTGSAEAAAWALTQPAGDHAPSEIEIILRDQGGWISGPSVTLEKLTPEEAARHVEDFDRGTYER